MLAGVMADTHDNIPLVRTALEAFRNHDVDHIIHAGDYVAPFTMEVLLAPDIPFIGVLGNNDGEKGGLTSMCSSLYEPPHIFKLGGREIVLVHREEDVPEDRARDADVVIFGHTHEAGIDEGPPLRLNPGEVSGWLHGNTTAALLDLDELDAEIIDLNPEE
jgi:hypothetical protein